MKDDDLDRLCTAGIFSALDVHFARLMLRLNREVRPGLGLAAAMVSRCTGEGHICLDLREVAGQPLDKDPGGLICPDLAVWSDNLRSSQVIGEPGDYKPLVLDRRARLYLYRYWQYQENLVKAIKARLAEFSLEEKAANSSPLAGSSRKGSLKDQLERLFPSSAATAVDWQKVAAFAAAAKPFCVISGGPGTGKTTTVAKILALLQEQAGSSELRIALAAPTGKAAARLQEAIKEAKAHLPCPDSIRQAIPETASTLHRLLGTIPGSPYFRHHEENPLPVEVVVIDEASMVDLALMSKLFQALTPQTRVILLGDKDQLSSVEAGAVLGDICETGERSFFSEDFGHEIEDICQCRLDPTLLAARPDQIAKDCLIQLEKSYRFSNAGGIGALSQKVRDSDASGAMKILRSRESPAVRWYPVPSGRLLVDAIRDHVLDGFRGYLQAVADLRVHPGGDPAARIGEIFELFGQFRILCAVREGLCGVTVLNKLVEQFLEEERLMRKGTGWYLGRPVVIGHNDYHLQLFNGDVGLFLPDPPGGGAGRVFFPGPEGGFRSFHPLRLPEHETVFAMTVHKSQGSEFCRVMFLLPDRDVPVLTRELVYTAITRAKEEVSIWGPENLFVRAMGRRTRRMSGLADALWRNPG